MLESRRKFIKFISYIGVSGITLTHSFLHTSLAKSQILINNFKLGNYEETLAGLFKGAEFIDSRKIKFYRLPHVAENGAVVPIKVTSTLKNIEKISILVEKNPHPLSAEFYLSPAVEPQVSARLKMAETSDVIVIIEAEGKFYRKTKKVKVIVGGCG
ncbi:MAG: thiosulfate oxidation carrier protein SoxY [Methylococcaceae bacterium]|nr:thiosulfate oxidation carrier protein SoxY [Methylococcaceae bacterium]